MDKKNLGVESFDQQRWNFGFITALLVILLCSISASDINRPFYGLHSWAEANGAWQARVQIKYGLSYTKGLVTWAVGDPPTDDPTHYLDHPHLSTLLDAAAMRIFGINDWSLRVTGIIQSSIILIFFIRILRGLAGEKLALLAGLFYVIFPITGYFGLGGWAILCSFTSMWCYLVLIGVLKDSPPPKRIYKYVLAVSLFLGLQMGWQAFFYELAIGMHYVARCLFGRHKIDKSMLAILIAAPLLSLAVNFGIMLVGHNWDFQKIIELYKWRSSKGEMRVFIWSKWFAKLWEFAVTNFTGPVLIISILYLMFGWSAAVWPAKLTDSSWRFPQFWLFLIPPVAQLFILKGCLWKHQSWQRPMAPFIAIAAALGVLCTIDLIKKLNHRLTYLFAMILVGWCLVFCIIGNNYYRGIRWQRQAKIDMFRMLNERTPPDKAILSFEDFIVNQHKSKGAFYRPEIAWYLDRDIVPAKTANEVIEKSKTGRFTYYLIPVAAQLMPTIDQLKRRFSFEYIPGVNGEMTADKKFLKAGMYPYMIFDLSSSSNE